MHLDQFKEVVQWQAQTFPISTALSKLRHLQQEVKELIEAIETGCPGKRLEFADCFILLNGAAANDGMTYRDIVDSIDEKMLINRSRTWGTPDSNGIINHIKE